MIEKQIETATIDVQQDGTIILREKVSIIEDGTELSHSYIQRSIKPDDDVSGENEKVQAIAIAARK